jgi:hypothetical protein
MTGKIDRVKRDIEDLRRRIKFFEDAKVENEEKLRKLEEEVV